jgi:uncharacterized protein (TIGR00297 family)
MLMEPFEINYLKFLLGAIIASILAVSAVKKHSLTFDGAVGMVVVGSLIYGIGGLVWAVPIIYFFISSSLLTKLRSPQKNEAIMSFDKAGARNLRQVLANGGIPTLTSILYLFTGWQGWFIVYLASIAEASADTWATEIGTMSSRKPVSILDFKEVETGRSGAVSFVGSSASIAGAVSTTLSGFLATQLFSSGWESFSLIVAIPSAGAVLGCFLDSVFGATLQAQYRDPDSCRLTEKRSAGDKRYQLVRGVSFIDNDLVNFFSGGAAAIVAMLLYYFLY